MAEAVTIENKPQSEEIRRIKANDEKALKELYVNNYPNVERFVLHNSGTKEDAKDIYQEAFITTWRNIMLNKFTVMQDGSLNGYLFRIAKNKWMDSLRTQRRRSITVDVSEGNLPDQDADLLTVEEEDHVERVKRHFSTMGNPCKELLQKFYFHRESLKEIASHYSWTEGTAKNNKYRCLQKLRAAILNNK
mgnify:CR=1 FL=1